MSIGTCSSGQAVEGLVPSIRAGLFSTAALHFPALTDITEPPNPFSQSTILLQQKSGTKSFVESFTYWSPLKNC